MAKRVRRSRKGGTKAEAVRQAFEKLGLKAKNRDISAAAKELGFDVAGSQISNLRKTLLSNKRGSKNGRSHGAHGKSIAVAALMEAKRFVRAAGSVDAAREALDTLARLSE